jgi:hypothetical protein
MIEDYLAEKQVEAESNNKRGLRRCLNDEVINAFFEIDETTDMMMFKSGNSLLIYSNGALKILNKRLTNSLFTESLKTQTDFQENLLIMRKTEAGLNPKAKPENEGGVQNA